MCIKRFQTIFIKAQSIEFWRGERCILDRVSLTVQAGEAVHLKGANGAGKTTLIRMLSGLLQPESGELSFEGVPYPQNQDALVHKLCYIGHLSGLNADLSVAENLFHLIGLQRAIEPTEVHAALGLAGLAGLSDRPVRTLSAGQKRRVSLTRLLFSESKPLWILDEPWTHLDAEGIAWVTDLIGEQAKRGGASLFSAHTTPDRQPFGYRMVSL